MLLLVLLLLSPFAHADQMGSGDPARANSPLECHVEEKVARELVTDEPKRQPALFFTLKYLCGHEAPEKMSAKEIRQAAVDCKGPVAARFKEKFKGLSREELEAQLGKTKLPRKDVQELASKSVGAIVDALFDPKKIVSYTEHTKESESWNMELADVWFAPIEKRLGLIRMDSEEGRSLKSPQYFRKVALEGVDYFEPSYGLREFHLGKPAHIAAAKALFPDAVEVLMNDHAMVGGAQVNSHLQTRSEKIDFGYRLLAVRRANGETAAVIQFLRAPRAKLDAWAERNASEKIELVRQLEVPGNGEPLELNMLEFPGVRWPKGTGTFTIKASCKPQ